jgi:hypothetical protein
MSARPMPLTHADDTATGRATGQAIDRADGVPGTRAVLGVLVAFAFALGVRVVFLDRAYDLFIDEITYFLISNNLATGHGVSLHGRPFFLHPPLFFFLQGPWIALTHPTGPLLEQVLSVRPMQSLLAALTAVVILLLGTRVAGWRVGVVAFVLFAVDPFTIRINSRNLLETTALLGVLGGYLALLWRPLDEGVPRRRVLLAGLGFGAALLTKEMTFFLTLLPMGLLFLAGRPLPRRTTLGVVGVVVATYAVYPLTVVLLGLGPIFVEDKLSGVLRFLGLVKTTGFVHGHGPSFLSAVLRNLDVFATTYTLVALGIPASMLLVWKGDDRRRVLGVLGISAYALLAYSIGLGTLEEQFFYFLVLPAMLSVPVAWGLFSRILDRRDFSAVRLPRGRPRDLGGAYTGAARVARVVLPVALVVSVAWSSFVWTQVRFTPDDGYRQVYGWLHANVPRGESLGVTTDPQELLLDGYVINPVSSGDEIRATRSTYVVISGKQIADGYTKNGVALEAWLRANGRPVFVVDGRTYGRLEVFEVNPPGG